MFLGDTGSHTYDVIFTGFEGRSLSIPVETMDGHTHKYIGGRVTPIQTLCVRDRGPSDWVGTTHRQTSMDTRGSVRDEVDEVETDQGKVVMTLSSLV